jgi:hypothetical protein
LIAEPTGINLIAVESPQRAQGTGDWMARTCNGKQELTLIAAVAVLFRKMK